MATPPTKPLEQTDTPQKSKLLALTDTPAMVAEGLPMDTEGKARWAFRRRVDLGLQDAFIRVGRRIYVDPAKFHELVRATGR